MVFSPGCVKCIDGYALLIEPGENQKIEGENWKYIIYFNEEREGKMDLNNLKVQEEGKRMDLRHPATGEVLTYDERVNEDGTKEFKTMHLIIGSSDSETYKKSQRKIIDRRLKQQQKFRSAKLTAAQLEEEAIISLADVTYGGKVFLKGKEVDITPGTVAIDLYKEFPWIREQASDLLEDRGSFLQN